MRISQVRCFFLLVILLFIPVRAEVSGKISAGGMTMKPVFAYASLQNPNYLKVLLLPYQPDPRQLAAAVQGENLVQSGKPFAEFHVWFEGADLKAIKYANLAIYGLPASRADGNPTTEYKWQGKSIASHLPTLTIKSGKLRLASSSSKSSQPQSEEQPVAAWSVKLDVTLKDLR